ncbi:MAG: bis(5'-nucleosyl)-tetraphosphatase (symmetrical) YqeK [Dehalococcoidia bacterium]|nr:bis(5'-nucleosyl)-tetraphosphatase (symmetrical) YqeK [Dehalococcoidia bacterium]
MGDLPDAIESRLIELPTGLRDHVERSREVGQQLAIRHGIDVRQVDTGIAAHDLARAVTRRVLLRESERLGLEIDFVERHQPLLLHGPVAAALLCEDDDNSSGAVLESVRFHTTGHPGMGDIAKVVFLADKLDPWKVERASFLRRVEETARTDLDAAILHYLDKTIERLVEDGQMVHPTAVKYRNDLISQRVGT